MIPMNAKIRQAFLDWEKKQDEDKKKYRKKWGRENPWLMYCRIRFLLRPREILICQDRLSGNALYHRYGKPERRKAGNRRTSGTTSDLFQSTYAAAYICYSLCGIWYGLCFYPEDHRPCRSENDGILHAPGTGTSEAFLSEI